MPSFQETTRHDASPSFSKNAVLERTQSQWLFTPQELLLSPSILDGMPVAQELANRQKGVNFITQVGIMLKLPQLTLATASVYLHRFFMRHAMVQNNKPGLHHYSVAATAIFLATKVEENYRKMKELVVACCRVAQKSPNLVIDDQSKEYWKWRDTILHNEDLLLEALCFDLQLEQPYRLLLDFLRYYDVQANKQLRNTSWAFLNDSLVTTMCLQLTPSTIAGSALYMGVKFAGIALPDDERGRPWWEQLGLDMHEIQRGCNLMAEVYENPALPRQGQKDAYTKDDDLAMFDRTRHPATPQADQSPTVSARSGSQGVKRDRDVADDQQSGEWGASVPSERPGGDYHLAPSPKRMRRDSTEDNPSLSQRSSQRGPPHPADGRPPNESAVSGDDVQKRIDEIINASSSRVPQPNLVRRPSAQPSQPSYQSSSSRRHSSGASNWNNPPSTYSNGQPDKSQPASRPESRDNGVYGQAESNEHARVVRRVPFGPPANEGPAQSTGRAASTSNVTNDIDDAEKVDYGSEEGEL
ncbi:cyclin domain containing protein [Cladophialophora carrionii]|uniref:RNA polymerase II holoenzyme cyclin-like subunit n=1 Tax=Cladophialophora carrionii TaxID=86049 RepID=A0A1C1CKI7_9EURO|nr:cyclin domain containing protein [Cladophialophora carrionii]